jgi:hypothetical protein
MTRSHNELARAVSATVEPSAAFFVRRGLLDGPENSWCPVHGESVGARAWMFAASDRDDICRESREKRRRVAKAITVAVNPTDVHWTNLLPPQDEFSPVRLPPGG